ncbi:hypothetical protein OIU78_026820 [Salix suchowensis]|nr:hypothetical protein OIU78_026820 [Salix suchowensis]
MKNTENEPFLLSSDQSLKPRRSKFREVSSRFLSPTSPSHNNGTPSPNQGSSSPLRPKPSSDGRKHRSHDDPGSIRGLWPSSSPSQSSNSQNNQGTLADHLGNARLKDLLDHKKDEKPTKSSSVFSLDRQRSTGAVFGRSGNDKKKESTKENHRPILGGSMRYTGKFHLPGKSSSSSSSSSLNSSSNSNPVLCSLEDYLLMKMPYIKTRKKLVHLGEIRIYSRIILSQKYPSAVINIQEMIFFLQL